MSNYKCGFINVALGVGAWIGSSDGPCRVGRDLGSGMGSIDIVWNRSQCRSNDGPMQEYGMWMM